DCARQLRTALPLTSVERQRRIVGITRRAGQAKPPTPQSAWRRISGALGIECPLLRTVHVHVLFVTVPALCVRSSSSIFSRTFQVLGPRNGCIVERIGRPQLGCCAVC